MSQTFVHVYIYLHIYPLLRNVELSQIILIETGIPGIKVAIAVGSQLF